MGIQLRSVRGISQIVIKTYINTLLADN